MEFELVDRRGPGRHPGRSYRMGQMRHCWSDPPRSCGEQVGMGMDSKWPSTFIWRAGVNEVLAG
jgi:hypothetical protein